MANNGLSVMRPRFADLASRRADFAATRDEIRAHVEALEDAWLGALLDGCPIGRQDLEAARAQLTTAEADLAMVDRAIARLAVH